MIKVLAVLVFLLCTSIGLGIDFYLCFVAHLGDVIIFTALGTVAGLALGEWIWNRSTRGDGTV